MPRLGAADPTTAGSRGILAMLHHVDFFGSKAR